MPIEHARNPLRRARLAARLELSDLAERTRISPGMLRYMDEGAFERLPPGIYARAWVRSVARALSLDPAEVLRELEPVLPQAAPPEPAPPARAKRLQRLIDQPSAGSVMNLIGSETCRRSAVAAVDGALLTAVTMAAWVLTAAAAGVDPVAVVPAGAIGIVAIALTVAAAYFVVFAGIGGRTPGAALMGLPVEPPARLDLVGAWRRGVAAAVAEASIVVDLLLAVRVDKAVLRTVLKRT